MTLLLNRRRSLMNIFMIRKSMFCATSEPNRGRALTDIFMNGDAKKGKGKRKSSTTCHGERSKEEVKRMRVTNIEDKVTNIYKKEKEISPEDILRKPKLGQLRHEDPSVKEMMYDFCEGLLMGQILISRIYAMVMIVSYTTASFGYRVLHAVPLEYGEMLGRGAFGEVYKWYDSESKMFMAVKAILHHGSGSEMQIGRTLKNEIDILKKLQHTRVVRYYGCIVRDTDVRIFIEYMPNGSVKDFMLKHQKPLQIDLTTKVTRQVLEGIAYLHENKILHRDIKASNVLLDDKMNAKLGDFGISKQVHNLTNSNTCCSTHVGTPYWMSPERILGKKYGKSADIWSLGCTVVEMITMNPPWHEFETNAAIFKIGSGVHPTYQLPSNCIFGKDFVSKTFEQQASQRPTAIELLKHPFLVQTICNLNQYVMLFSQLNS